MDAASEYNRLVAADPAAAAEQGAWMADEFVRRGLTFAGEAMRSSLRPHFVARAEWDALCQAAREHSLLADEELEIHYARATSALGDGRLDQARQAVARAQQLAGGSPTWERRLSAIQRRC